MQSVSYANSNKHTRKTKTKKKRKNRNTPGSFVAFDELESVAVCWQLDQLQYVKIGIYLARNALRKFHIMGNTSSV